MSDRILLIHPPAKRIKFHTANFPIALASISPFLRQAGWSVEVLDINLLNLNRKQVRARLREILPKIDLVGISANMNAYSYIEWLAETIKDLRPDLPIMAGGPGPASTAPILLQNSRIDAVAIGEGEVTAAPLAAALAGDGYLSQAPGAVYLEEAEVKYGPVAPRLMDLDSAPRPDYSLFSLDRYIRSDESTEKGVSMTTSRGCPFRCTFCYRSLSSEVTRKSPEKVADDMLHLRRNYGVAFFFMDDDIFTLHPEWLDSFCRILIDTPNRPMWHCNGRVGTFSPEILADMKQAGCHIIRFGLETANENLLRSANKHFSKNQMVESINMVRRAGIINMNSFLIGLPGETTETIKETMDFVTDNKLIIDLSFATPFPNTPLYEMALERGLIDNELEYFRSFSIQHTIYTLRVNFTDLSDETLRRWRRRILKQMRKSLDEMIQQKIETMLFKGVPNLKPFETFAGRNIQPPGDDEDGVLDDEEALEKIRNYDPKSD